jgi:REP element-mobilizing transposase RayT
MDAHRITPNGVAPRLRPGSCIPARRLRLPGLPEFDYFNDLKVAELHREITVMPQSLVQIYVHIVFSTADRIPFLNAPGIRNNLHRYLHGTCRNLGSPALRVNGTKDHVHLLCRLGKQCDVSDLVRDLKRSSSHWLGNDSLDQCPFRWQKGYGAFSAGNRELIHLADYIDNQEAHHRRVSFKEEFRKLCEEQGMVIDERYVWE